MRVSLLFSTILALSTPVLCERSYKLLPRQLDVDPLLTCKTCTECFGEGNLICSSVGCYNPDKHEQCCADASICVGIDNSCCDYFGGPGVSATTDGTPIPLSLYTPSYTPTVSPTSFECRRGETGEECCSKGTGGLQFCGGSFPNYVCYLPVDQTCCDNDVACYGEGCCQVIDSKPKEGKARSSTTNGPTATGETAKGEAATTGAPTAATGSAAGSVETASPTSSNMAAVGGILGGGAAAAGVLGLAALL